MIYLASPSSHPEPIVEETRFQWAAWAAAKLIELGHLVFAPIPHSHPITRYGGNGSWEYWAEFDKHMLGACDELWVLCLDGWDTSVGVAAEVKWAKAAGMKIRYITVVEISRMIGEAACE